MYFSIRHFADNEMRLFAEISPMILAVGGWLMAQASGLDPSIANLIGNGVTVAVLAWYVLYDVRVRTPNMLSAFAKEQDEIRKAFKLEQADSRETFARTIETLRSTFIAEQSEVRREYKQDRAEIRAQHAQEIDSWRKMVSENMAAMRTAVHDVKDTAQMVMTRNELGQKERAE